MSDELSKKIAEGWTAAQNLVKELANTPTLINTDKTQGVYFAVPLQIETHQQNCQAEVSNNIVISRQNKVSVSDNVAPGPYTWELSGYIPGLPNKAEYTNKWTPTVKLNTDILRYWHKRGSILSYKDIDGAIYKKVAIKSLSISFQKDCQNMTPVKLTLQEINVMDDALAEASQSIVSSTPLAGTKLGKAIETGSTICKKVPEVWNKIFKKKK